jgi:hypothetical protein
MSKVASNTQAQPSSLQKFIVSLSKSSQDPIAGPLGQLWQSLPKGGATNQKMAMAMMTRLAENEGVARNTIEQGALDIILRLPKERSSEVASFLLALAGSSEDNATLLVNAPGVLDSLAGLIKNKDPNGVLVAKRIAGYIGSPARDAIRGSDEIVVGLCEIGAAQDSNPISNDALDTISDLARYNTQVQATAGTYLAAFVKRIPPEADSSDRSSVIRAISSIVDNHYDNQMKFVEILYGDDEYVKRLLSKKNGVSCVRDAIRHPTKHSAQRTNLCKIDVFRKIVVDRCNANDDAFKGLLKALCCGHSGNYSRFVADGFVFPEELNIKGSYKKRKADESSAAVDAAAPESKCVKPNEPEDASTDVASDVPDVPDVHRLKCENDMLRAEIEDMRRRLVSSVCQRSPIVVL